MYDSLALPCTHSTTFTGLGSQVRACREWLRTVLTSCSRTSPGPYPREACATIELLLSELATNAIKHTRSGMPGGVFSVIVTVDIDGMRVSVRDQGGTTLPIPCSTKTDEEGGRGLCLLDALAQAWGTRGGPAGRLVWFEHPCKPDEVTTHQW